MGDHFKLKLRSSSKRNHLSTCFNPIKISSAVLSILKQNLQKTRSCSKINGDVDYSADHSNLLKNGTWCITWQNPQTELCNSASFLKWKPDPDFFTYLNLPKRQLFKQRFKFSKSYWCFYIIANQPEKSITKINQFIYYRFPISTTIRPFADVDDWHWTHSEIRNTGKNMTFKTFRGLFIYFISASGLSGKGKQQTANFDQNFSRKAEKTKVYVSSVTSCGRTCCNICHRCSFLLRFILSGNIVQWV